MTNLQGAPEALPDPSPDQLRAIARTARNSSGSASDDCGPLAYVMYGWRAAAIAFRAQQAATHVQNPAEIEHVAGDVSKNRPGSNMAQQPAPSAAVFGLRLVPVEPTDQMVQAAHHIDLSYMPGQEGADRAAIYRAMIAAAPQPAVQQWNDLIGKETYADADGLLVWRDEVDFAIPTPQADSVTAPAGGGVAGSSMREEFEAYWRSKYAPLPMNTRLHDDGRYGDPTIQQEWESWRAIHTPTPPAQAADSVLEDAEAALRKVLSVVQRYLPPDGPTAHDAMTEITEIVDPWPLGPLEKS